MRRSGGYGGVAWLAERGYFAPEKVQHVIIPEPLHKDRICLGHRGVWWAEVETHGRIAHGSMPFLGDSAPSDIWARFWKRLNITFTRCLRPARLRCRWCRHRHGKAR